MILFGRQVTIPEKGLRQIKLAGLITKALSLVGIVTLISIALDAVPFDGKEQKLATIYAVRFALLVCFALLCYYDSERQDKTLSIIWAAVGLLVNPVIKVPLTATVWMFIDWGLLAFLLITTVAMLPKVRIVKREGIKRGDAGAWAWDESDKETLLGCGGVLLILIAASIIVAAYKWLIGK